LLKMLEKDVAEGVPIKDVPVKGELLMPFKDELVNQ